MEISKALLNHYLIQITGGWSVGHDDHPDHVSDYAFYVERMGRAAQRMGEDEALRLGFDYVLAHPEVRAGELATVTLDYEDAQARELIRFCREVIWPGREPSSLDNVRLTNESLPEWRARVR